MSLILSGTDGLSDVDGSAATPAIRGTDANTGIFFPAADTIAFAEGGAEAMRIDSSGNVGIGTTNPDVFASGHERSFGVVATGATSAINVSGSSASRLQLGVGSTRYGLIYQDASNFMQIGTTTALPISFITSNTERMRIDSSGNLGVGTTSPTNKLDVKGVLGIQRSTVAETSTLTMETGEFDIKAAPYGYSIRFFNGTGGSSSEKVRIDTSGNLLVGTTTAAAVITVSAANGTTPMIGVSNTTSGNASGYGSSLQTAANNTSSYHFYGSTLAVGNWYLYGNGTSSWSSDERLKHNIQTTRDGYIEDVCKLRVVKYQWKNGPQQVELGLIAQEVEQIFPGLVQDDLNPISPDDPILYKQLKGSVLPMILLKAIQEQQALITQLQADVAALKGA